MRKLGKTSVLLANLRPFLFLTSTASLPDVWSLQTQKGLGPSIKTALKKNVLTKLILN